MQLPLFALAPKRLTCCTVKPSVAIVYSLTGPTAEAQRCRQHRGVAGWRGRYLSTGSAYKSEATVLKSKKNDDEPDAA